METWEWIVLGVAIAAVLLLALAFVRVRRRRTHLKSRFGPEYERAVEQNGTGVAEKRLTQLEGERDELRLTPLAPAARERYLDDWRQVESRFVSDPRDAARAAERLVLRALGEQGYPEDAADDERLVSLVSVDHPDSADRLRHGHAMLESDDAQATENLRKAMLDFRSVLEDVLHPAERSAA